MSKWGLRLAIVLTTLFIVDGVMVVTAYADTLKSSHYQFQITDLGGGGLGPSSSTGYQSALSLGDPVAGNSNSNNYKFEAGSQTTPDPRLGLSIDTSDTNFGTFSPTSPATATAQFTVVDYTSYGYVVQIVGDTPTYKNHSIAAMSTSGTSVPGSEQFGINLVKNPNFCGSGCDVGANPNYGQFGAATAGPVVNLPNTNYGTSGVFEYNSGDTIVQSPKSSGAISYTITFMVNVTALTPAGGYISDQQIICTGTY